MNLTDKQDLLIYKWERSLGENDRDALYKHKELPVHLMNLLRDLMDEYVIEMMKTKAIEKGTPLHYKFIKAFPLGTKAWHIKKAEAERIGTQFHQKVDASVSGKKEVSEPKGREEIVRFVNFLDRKPTKNGWYAIRLNYYGNGAVDSLQWKDDKWFDETEEYTLPVSQWLEIIPAKEEFNKTKVDIQVVVDKYGYTVHMKHEGKQWNGGCPYNDPNDNLILAISNGLKAMEKKYYETE